VKDGGFDGESSETRSQCFCRSPYFYYRVLLLICAVAISFPLIYKSRPDREHSIRTAFSALSTSRGYVRISGDVKYPGVYPIGVNTMTIAAIKMAEPLSASMGPFSETDVAAHVGNGTVLHVSVRPDGILLLTRSQMTASERLVMGIPLDINAMSEADFDKLPGIGPVMGKRISEYRQKNGGTMKVTDLLSIEGIGEKKYNNLLRYF
jgi:competence protein ComEA